MWTSCYWSYQEVGREGILWNKFGPCPRDDFWQRRLVQLCILSQDHGLCFSWHDCSVCFYNVVDPAKAGSPCNNELSVTPSIQRAFIMFFVGRETAMHVANVQSSGGAGNSSHLLVLVSIGSGDNFLLIKLTPKKRLLLINLWSLGLRAWKFRVSKSKGTENDVDDCSNLQELSMYPAVCMHSMVPSGVSKIPSQRTVGSTEVGPISLTKSVKKHD